MVVPFEEEVQNKIEKKIDNLEKIIQDETIEDQDKFGMYNSQFKNNINQETSKKNNKGEDLNEDKDKLEKIEKERMNELNSLKKWKMNEIKKFPQSKYYK